MPLHLPTLITRTGSAIVFGALMLAALLGPAWAFGVVFLLIHILALKEYFALIAGFMPPVTKGLQIAAQIFGGLVIGVFALLIVIPWLATTTLLFVLLALVLYPVCMLLAAALSSKSSFSAGITALGGNLYITLPIVVLFVMRAVSSSNFVPSGDYNLPLLLIVFIWCNDSFAYLSGSLIGKTPLTAISPKKTWEGTAGGALLTVVAAFLFSYFWGTYPFWLTIGFSLCAAIAGTLGDLLESRLKRLAGVKDSGKLMPGHGGALDRFDSLLVAAPFAFVYFCVTSIIMR